MGIIQQMMFTTVVFKEVLTKVITSVKSKEPFPDGGSHCAIVIAMNTAEPDKGADMCQKIAPELTTKCVHSLMPINWQKAVMQKSNKNLVQIVVVIVSMLREGFDYPCISVAGIVTRIRSPLVFAQFVGCSRRVIDGREMFTREYI